MLTALMLGIFVAFMGACAFYPSQYIPSRQTREQFPKLFKNASFSEKRTTLQICLQMHGISLAKEKGQLPLCIKISTGTFG